MDLLELEEFIDLYKVPQFNKSGYILGIFEPGITVYNQQLRSLNILYALHELGKLKNSPGIAIIGGGIAGLTFAAGALELGYKVDLFEKSSLLLPYQYGSETRRIHPHFYNWPLPLSEYPYSDLPFFRWKDETASTVSKDIYKSYRQITTKHKKNYSEHKNTRVTSEDFKLHPKNIEIYYDDGKEINTKFFSAVILATGYGVEKSVQRIFDSRDNSFKNVTKSYWRNDQFEQVSLTNDKFSKYIISGTGDGALNDLFRLKIKGFSTNSIINNLKNNSENYGLLVKELKKVLEEYKKTLSPNREPTDNQFLYRAFQKLLDEGVLNDMVNLVKDRIRNDNTVILHHRNLSVRQIFNLTRASLFNNLLAFVLVKKSFCGFKKFDPNSNFIYQKANGENLLISEEEKEEIKRNRAQNLTLARKIINSVKRTYPNKIADEDVKLVFRHGSDKKSTLLELGIEENFINQLEKKQRSNNKGNRLYPIWESGWWDRNTLSFGKSAEFVEPELAIIARTFVASIASALNYSIKTKIEKEGSVNFRVTLHRTVKKRDGYYYQQISDYFGGDEVLDKGIGRLFPMDIGVVGYSCETGRSLVLRRVKPESDYLKTWGALMTKKEDRKKGDFIDFKKNKYTKDKLESTLSLFTCPIFFKKGNSLYPLFCLFIDSSHIDFSEKTKDIQEMVGMIYSITSSFVNQLQLSAYKDDIVNSEDLSDSLQKVKPNFKDEEMNEKIEKSSALQEVELFNRYKDLLIIKKVTPHYLTLNYRY